MARIKQRADGRFYVQVYIGRVDGKSKYKSVYGKTQKEADKKALALRAEMRKGLDISAGHDSFGEWAARWLEGKALEIVPAGLAQYKSAVDHLNGRLECAEIADIRTADIQAVVNALAKLNPNTGRPSSKRTLQGIKMTARQIFQLVIDNRVIDHNPALAVKIPTQGISPVRHRRALTDAERRWIEETPHRAQRAAMIMLYAGLRRSEVVALMWSDVDLAAHTISVTKAAEVVKSRFAIRQSAKTEAGNRIIDIPAKLADFLAREPRESIYVCPRTNGGPQTPSSWDRMWETYLLDLNIKYGDFSLFRDAPVSKYDPRGVPFVIDRITPHMLRHTFCTMLYFAGVDVMTTMRQMGHSDVKTTMGVYTHLDAQFQRESMGKLNDFLDSTSQIQVSHLKND